MLTVKTILDNLDGCTLLETMHILTALGCEHDEVYAMAPGRGLRRVVCTTPSEMSYNRPARMLAAACTVKFKGGPPPGCTWFWGSMLAFTADRLLAHEVAKRRREARGHVGQRGVYKPNPQKQVGRGGSSTNDENTVYLWSSSGRTAVRGCTSHS